MQQKTSAATPAAAAAEKLSAFGPAAFAEHETLCIEHSRLCFRL